MLPEAQAVCRQLEERGPLTFSEIRAVVLNYNQLADVNLVIAELGSRITTQLNNKTTKYIMTTESEIARKMFARTSHPIQMALFSRDERLFIRTHAARLNLAVSGLTVEPQNKYSATNIIAHLSACEPAGINISRYLHNRPAAWSAFKEIINNKTAFEINGCAWLSNYTFDPAFSARWLKSGSIGNRVCHPVNNKRRKLNNRRIYWRPATSGL